MLKLMWLAKTFIIREKLCDQHTFYNSFVKGDFQNLHITLDLKDYIELVVDTELNKL